MRLDDDLRFFSENFASLIKPSKQGAAQIFRLEGTDRRHGVGPTEIKLDKEFDRWDFRRLDIAEATANGGRVIREIPDRTGEGTAEHEKNQDDHDHIDHGCHIRTHMSRGMHADFRAF